MFHGAGEIIVGNWLEYVVLKYFVSSTTSHFTMIDVVVWNSSLAASSTSSANGNLIKLLSHSHKFNQCSTISNLSPDECLQSCV